jgi:hypothetical protein
MGFGCARSSEILSREWDYFVLAPNLFPLWVSKVRGGKLISIGALFDLMTRKWSCSLAAEMYVPPSVERVGRG